MLTRRTDRMIEELIASTYGNKADARTRHLFSHALHGLVRLAKAEQMEDIRRDTEQAVGQAGAVAAHEEMEQLLRRAGMRLRERRSVEDGGRRG